mgnify:CR=1
ATKTEMMKAYSILVKALILKVGVTSAYSDSSTCAHVIAKVWTVADTNHAKVW